MRDKYEKARLRELEEFFKKNPALGEKERKAVDKLTHDLVGKLLHEPTVNLKSVNHEIDRFEYARMLGEIFALFDEPKDD